MELKDEQLCASQKNPDSPVTSSGLEPYNVDKNNTVSRDTDTVLIRDLVR